MSKRKKSKKRKYLFIILFLVFIICLIGFIKESWNSQALAIKTLEQKYTEIRIEAQKLKKYTDCLNVPYKDDSTDTAFNELVNSLANNRIAIYFEDINNSYTLTYNENKNHYAASIIKLYAAIYLLDNARAGTIDLNSTITYTNKYVATAGNKLRLRNIGEEITLSDLINYSISVSDNGAYFMLSDYIGVNQLKEYAKNTLDVNLTINQNDLFGYLDVTDTNKLLNYIYKFIQIDDEYTTILTNAMNNTYYNALNFDNITYLHKYGYYDQYFNNIGIYNENTPYLISIFTYYGNPDKGALTKVQEINKKIYDIYQANLQAKDNYCYNIAYN